GTGVKVGRTGLVQTVVDAQVQVEALPGGPVRLVGQEVLDLDQAPEGAQAVDAGGLRADRVVKDNRHTLEGHGGALLGYLGRITARPWGVSKIRSRCPAVSRRLSCRSRGSPTPKNSARTWRSHSPVRLVTFGSWRSRSMRGLHRPRPQSCRATA